MGGAKARSRKPAWSQAPMSMGFSPMTRSAAPGSKGSAAAPRISLMKRRSSAPSTTLPPISNSTLISIAFSTSPDEERRHSRQDQVLDDGGPSVENQGAANVASVRLAPPVAHEGVVDKGLAIDARSGE